MAEKPRGYDPTWRIRPGPAPRATGLVCTFGRGLLADGMAEVCRQYDSTAVCALDKPWAGDALCDEHLGVLYESGTTP